MALNSDFTIDKPINPVEVEQAIFDISNEIARGVSIVSELEKAYLEAKRIFDRAEARAILKATGTIPEKKAQVELEVIAERDALDAAYSAFRFADRRAKALNIQLDGVRSIGASVRSMYQVAGRGEGA